jgi:hypothetical protein
MLTEPTDESASPIRDEDGVSLIELVLAMGLMTVIGAMTLTFFISLSSASTKTVKGNFGTSAARNVLEAWTRLLSLADSPSTAGAGSGRIVQLTPTSAIFYANVNRNRATTSGARTAPTKISLALESGQLVERDYAPLSPTAPSAYPGLPTSTQYLARDVTISGWLFAPYVLATPPSIKEPNDCSGGTAGLCAGIAEADALLPTVVRVDITFSVQSKDGPAQTFSSSAFINGGRT